MSLGDCYRSSAEFVLANPSWLLVHGQPIGTGGKVEGIRYGHAWAELQVHREFVVRDCETGVIAPRVQFYRVGQIEADQVVRFTIDEVRAHIADREHWGPWV